MKEAAKYAGSLIASILFSFALSWSAVYGYWFSAHWFHSVRAVRLCEWLGTIILAPVRVAFWLSGDLFDQSAPLSDPMSYAATNAVILGTVIYFLARPFLFSHHSDGHGRDAQRALK